jgi:arylsulfatase A-like enzyme
LLVLTSDHGEEFLEHGAVLHGRALYREILHVPLILAGPGIPRGARYGGEVSPVDLVPTLLGALDLEAPAGVEGIDLSAAWRDPGAWPPRRAVFSETRSWAGSEQGDFRARIRRGPWTLDLDQRSGKRRLFHLEEDPAELADASSRHPDVARELWSELEGYLAGTRGPLESTPASQEELEALQALGYR